MGELKADYINLDKREMQIDIEFEVISLHGCHVLDRLFYKEFVHPAENHEIYEAKVYYGNSDEDENHHIMFCFPLDKATEFFTFLQKNLEEFDNE